MRRYGFIEENEDLPSELRRLPLQQRRKSGQPFFAVDGARGIVGRIDDNDAASRRQRDLYGVGTLTGMASRPRSTEG